MEQTATAKPNIAQRLWTWFLRSGERMRVEDEEIRELRLQQLRAEEESIEKYGSLKIMEAGEEPERDLRFFEAIDAIGAWFGRMRRRIWLWMHRMAKDSAVFSSVVARISKRSRERALQRAHRVAEQAVSGVDDAGESIFEHLPESWQAAYLAFEDDVVSMIEEKERRIGAKIEAVRTRRRAAALRRHDARTVAMERVRGFWEKETFLCWAIVFILALGSVAVATHVNSKLYYEYAYNGRTLGIVHSKSDVTGTLDIIVEKMKAVYGGEILIDARKDLSFRTLYGEYETDSADEILTNLSYLHDVSTYGYAIVADGETVTVLGTEADAKIVLRKLRAAYLPEGDANAETSFAEEVGIERVATTSNRIATIDKALEQISVARKESKHYTVASGDTFSGVASLTGLSVAELHELNPDVNTEKLKVGQDLALEAAKPAITVVTVSNETYEAEMPFETVYVDNDAVYQGESWIQEAGKNGEHLVSAVVTRENGTVVSTEITSDTVLREPVSQIVVRGTKPVPAREGTGTFIWPTAGYISSPFGMRWGRLHMGIDIAFATGIPIYAADGGTVIASSWNDSYGYYVLIDHGGGISTRYAHCSKLLVNIGEKVYQGQKIALMGSTGHSTGPHCHFEVRINETPKDPLNYLP